MRTQRKRPGRQPKPARDRRSEVVRATVTPAELKAIKAAAGSSTVSDFVRSILKGATEDPSPINENTPKKGARR